MSEPVDAPPSDPPAGARVGGQQRQARALATRSAILAAAAEEFATASYHEASLSRILERSKVTKGALYFHFVSKESIASAVVDEMEVLCRDLVVRARSKERDPLCTAAQVAREVQDALAGPVLRAGQRLCSEGFAGPQRPGWPFTFWQDVFGGLFADAARAGLLAAGVDHAALSRAVVDISAGAFVTSLGVSGLRDLAMRVCQNWELLLGATADPAWLREWRAGGGMGAVLGPHLTGGWVVEA
jgi:AcrR family transcriptional regulator